VKTSVKPFWFPGLAVYVALQLQAQVLKPNLQNISQWGVINRSVEAIDEDGKKAVCFDEAANNGS